MNIFATGVHSYRSRCESYSRKIEIERLHGESASAVGNIHAPTCAGCLALISRAPDTGHVDVLVCVRSVQLLYSDRKSNYQRRVSTRKQCVVRRMKSPDPTVRSIISTTAGRELSYTACPRRATPCSPACSSLCCPPCPLPWSPPCSSPCSSPCPVHPARPAHDDAGMFSRLLGLVERTGPGRAPGLLIAMKRLSLAERGAGCGLWPPSSQSRKMQVR